MRLKTTYSYAFRIEKYKNNVTPPLYLDEDGNEVENIAINFFVGTEEEAVIQAKRRGTLWGQENKERLKSVHYLKVKTNEQIIDDTLSRIDEMIKKSDAANG